MIILATKEKKINAADFGLAAHNPIWVVSTNICPTRAGINFIFILYVAGIIFICVFIHLFEKSFWAPIARKHKQELHIILKELTM